MRIILLFIITIAIAHVSSAQEEWDENEQFQAYLMQTFVYDDVQANEYFKGNGTINMNYFSGGESDTLRDDFFRQRQPRRYFDFSISLIPEIESPETFRREKKFFYYKRGDVINRYIEYVDVHGTLEEWEEMEDRISDDMCRYALDTNNHISLLTITDNEEFSFYLASSKAVMRVEVNIDPADRSFLTSRDIDINKECERVLDFYLRSVNVINVGMNSIHQLASLKSWGRDCGN